MAEYPDSHLTATISSNGRLLATYPYDMGIGVFSLAGGAAQHLFTLPIAAGVPAGDVAGVFGRVLPSGQLHRR
jgi:hypothetical protein